MNAQKRNDSIVQKTVPFNLVMSHNLSDRLAKTPESNEFIGASGTEGFDEGAS